MWFQIFHFLNFSGFVVWVTHTMKLTTSSIFAIKCAIFELFQKTFFFVESWISGAFLLFYKQNDVLSAWYLKLRSKSVSLSVAVDLDLHPLPRLGLEAVPAKCGSGQRGGRLDFAESLTRPRAEVTGTERNVAHWKREKQLLVKSLDGVFAHSQLCLWYLPHFLWPQAVTCCFIEWGSHHQAIRETLSFVKRGPFWGQWCQLHAPHDPLLQNRVHVHSL